MTPHPLIIAAVLLTVSLPCAGAQYAGWAAGDPADGYGTIIATVDSGATWVRQGSSGQIANTSLSVCAVNPNGGATWVTQEVSGAPPASLWTVSFSRTPVPEPVGAGVATVMGYSLFIIWRRRSTCS